MHERLEDAIVKTGRRLSASIGRRTQARDDLPGISPVDIADHNSRTALAMLRRFGPLTRQELSARLGLTEPAITGIMRRLQDAGLIGERKRQTGGRYSAVEFMLLADGAHSVGVNLTTSGTEIVIMNLAGVVVSRRKIGDCAEIGGTVAAMLRDAGIQCGTIGNGIALGAGTVVDREAIRASLAPAPVFFLDDTEAAVIAERMLGIGEPEGGLVVILIDETVRAGLLIGGKIFRGMHRRAGQIGAMRSGQRHASLDEVATVTSLERHIAEKGPASVEDWAMTAASHLLDAIVAISGFVAPGAVLIGGSLPDHVIDMIIARMMREREKQSAYFVAAPWIPPVNRTSLPGAGIAAGAALQPFLEILLPKVLPQPLNPA